MGRTIDEDLIEQGRKQGQKSGELRARREALLDFLGGRFGKVPEAVRTKVKATRDIEQLRNWSRRAATAATLADVGITT
jgi:hypothetical protein